MDKDEKLKFYYVFQKQWEIEQIHNIIANNCLLPICMFMRKTTTPKKQDYKEEQDSSY